MIWFFYFYKVTKKVKVTEKNFPGDLLKKSIKIAMVFRYKIQEFWCGICIHILLAAC